MSLWRRLRDWFPVSLIGTFKHKRHVAYVPAHRLAVPLVNPNDGHPGFFTVMPLPVISAEAFERALPEWVINTVVHESRN